jgi:transcriptional regulator with XRE-family HTH domain
MMDIYLPGDLLREARMRAGLSQGELARRTGTSQPAIARLESSTSNPTVATLRRLLRGMGFDLSMDLRPLAHTGDVTEAYKRDIDRTLIAENLKRSVAGRIQGLAELQEFDAELRRAMKSARTRQ